jgi:hypothetical protein
MAYTMQEKAVFEYRLKQVKKGLKKKAIKYYGPAVASLPVEVKGAVTYQDLRNVMNAGIMDERALAVLEVVAGIKPLEPLAA